MQIGFELILSMTLFHKYTMEKMTIDKIIKREYNEDSSEFKTLCENYKDAIGFERTEGNKDEFDKELMKELVKVSEDSEKETIENITEVIKQCYYKDTTAVINFAGYIINPKDFCAVRVNEFRYNITKK